MDFSIQVSNFILQSANSLHIIICNYNKGTRCISLWADWLFFARSGAKVLPTV